MSFFFVSVALVSAKWYETLFQTFSSINLILLSV